MVALLGRVTVLLSLVSTGWVASAQEAALPDTKAFANPFDRPGKIKSVKEEDAAERVAEQVKNRFPVFSSDAIKKLMAADPSDGKVRILRKERSEAAYSELRARFEEFRSGRTPVAILLRSSERLASSLLALEPDSKTRMAILQHNVQVAKEVEKFAVANMNVGVGTSAEVSLAKYERLSAQILVEEAKALDAK